jgi:hypothetical protein
MTIRSLHEALECPTQKFRTLHRLRWDKKSFCRSLLFAEAEVIIDDKRYLLCMPLRTTALQYAERFALCKKHLYSALVPQISILRDELIYTDSLGRESSCDILLEPLPDALPLKDAIATGQSDAEYAATLLRSLAKLDLELQRLDVTLSNLKVENLLIDSNNRIFPTHWYYATEGYGGDNVALRRIEGMLSSTESSSILSDSSADYNTSSLSGHISVGVLCEGLIAIEDESGWGFVDEKNNYVIAPMYRSVTEFCEGRAVVESTSGMGLIDRNGDYIIEPRYQIVNYDFRSGRSEVLEDGQWREFDYIGRELKE